jgi:hypothetical protein
MGACLRQSFTGWKDPARPEMPAATCQAPLHNRNIALEKLGNGLFTLHARTRIRRYCPSVMQWWMGHAGTFERGRS